MKAGEAFARPTLTVVAEDNLLGILPFEGVLPNKPLRCSGEIPLA